MGGRAGGEGGGSKGKGAVSDFSDKESKVGKQIGGGREGGGGG